MADPCEIVGVIGVAGKIIQAAVQLGLDWKDIPSDTKAFLLELQALKTVLSETYTNVVLNKDFLDAFDSRHSVLLSQFGSTVPPTDTQIMISACHSELGLLLGELEKRGQGGRAGWERIKGAFLSKRTREAVENLHQQSNFEQYGCYRYGDTYSTHAQGDQRSKERVPGNTKYRHTYPRSST
jgi:hypothetical protein